MLQQRAPLILAGQIYLQEELNEYLIVTKNVRGQVTYAGKGFVGQAEDQSFIEHFNPVNPVDVDAAEIAELLTHCPTNTKASTGYISDSVSFAHAG
jgi:hypothetical protein